MAKVASLLAIVLSSVLAYLIKMSKRVISSSFARFLIDKTLILSLED